jgi:hypothetical protein
MISSNPMDGRAILRAVHIFLALCLVPTAVATAQSASAQWPLDSGSMVRIHSPIFSDNPQVGTVVKAQGDTLQFRPWRGTTSTAVGLTDISRLDLYQGTHGRKAKGALIGFLIGGGLAAGITAATWKKPTNGCGLCVDFGRGGDAAVAGLFGGVAGGLLGFLVGAHETDTWARVWLPNR